jgi:hypothetical protein
MADKATKLAEISKIQNHNWVLLIVIILIVAFFTWQIYLNMKAIWKVWSEYSSNEKTIKSNKMNASDNDDETYDAPARLSEQPISTTNNANISNSITKLKEQHKHYNTALKQVDPNSGDVVDERILSADHDNY